MSDVGARIGVMESDDNELGNTEDDAISDDNVLSGCVNSTRLGIATEVVG